MLSFGGISLATPSVDLMTALSGLRLDELVNWESLDKTSNRRDAWSHRGDIEINQGRLGVLSWPTGAMRWAVGQFLVGAAQLDQIRMLAYGGVSRFNALPLVMTDDAGGQVTTSLFMLPARPLAQNLHLQLGEEQIYLLTLVDERYFWYEKSADIVVSGGTTTWAQLFAAIASALGITLTTDTIDTAYLKPAANLTAHYEFIPHLLDACCANVGHRFVRKITGECITQSSTTAKASQDAQIDYYRRLHGGTFDFRPTTLNDLQALAPATFSLAFPQTSSDSPHLESATLSALALVEYQGIAGHSGVRFAHDVAIYNGSNSSELSNLTVAQAKDFFRFKLAKAFITYPGIIPYVVEGMSDLIEWSPLMTRVERGPLNDLTESYNRHGAAGTVPDTPPDDDCPGWLGDDGQHCIIFGPPPPPSCACPLPPIIVPVVPIVITYPGWPPGPPPPLWIPPPLPPGIITPPIPRNDPPPDRPINRVPRNPNLIGHPIRWPIPIVQPPLLGPPPIAHIPDSPYQPEPAPYLPPAQPIKYMPPHGIRWGHELPPDMPLGGQPLGYQPGGAVSMIDLTAQVGGVLPEANGGSGVVGTYSAGGYHQITGTARFYYLGMLPGLSSAPSGSFALPDKQFAAFPWICRRTGTINALYFKVGVAGSAGSKVQMGFYANSSTTNIMGTGSVRNDLGEKAITSGNTIVQYTGLSVGVTAGTAYWFAVNGSITGGGPTLLALSQSQIEALLGNNGTMLADSFLAAATLGSYSTGLPSFPLTTTDVIVAAGGTIPAIAVSYSA